MLKFPDYIRIDTSQRFYKKSKPRTQKSEYEDGYQRIIRTTSKLNSIYSFTAFVMNLNDLKRLMMFFKDDLAHGTRKMTWQDPLTKEKILVRFLGDLEYNLVKNETSINAFDAIYQFNVELEVFE